MINSYCYNTKIGRITIVEDENSIIRICFGEHINADSSNIETKLLKLTINQIEEYLEGKRSTFDLPLKLEGTEFQKKVWNALIEIPYGSTVSYKHIAKAIGNEKASRAVGMANNKNPILLIVPCHRVVGANGKLVGYAGGLDIKEKLLNIEKVNIDK